MQAVESLIPLEFYDKFLELKVIFFSLDVKLKIFSTICRSVTFPC